MNITELALYKLLCDPKRQSILHYAAERPITVKELAEKLNEKQSRLYYHVKKLEEAGVLEVVETKAIGNLTEKYYHTKDAVYTISDTLQKEHNDEIMNHTRHIIETGLKKIHLSMKNDIEDVPSMIATMYHNQTEEEWSETCDNIIKQVRPSQNPDTLNLTAPTNEKTKSRKTNNYAYVFMSYRIDD